MTSETGKAADEGQIRQLIEDWAKALRARDVDGVMSCYAPDIVTFDIAPPLQCRGAVAYRKNWEAWFPTFQGPIDYQIRDLSISASDDVAFCHSVNRIGGTRTDGEQTDVWLRATVCCRKLNGKWVIAHEHLSVPFYMDGSYRAAVDLKP